MSVICIDNGCSSIKIGYSGNSKPSYIIPNIIGRAKLDKNNKFIGELNELNMIYTYPMKHGFVNNFNDIEYIYENIFSNKLKIESQEYPIGFIDSVLTSNKQRESFTQMFFETFNVPGITFNTQELMSLYALGKTSGLVLNSGAGVTSVFPVYKGMTFTSAIDRIDIGGNDITEYLINILSERGYYYTSSSNIRSINDLKDTFCYLSSDYENDIKSSNIKDKTYKLLNGDIISIGKECFRCTEPLFDLELFGNEQGGIHKLIYSSINLCSIDVRQELYNNIIISGGNTLIPNFSERLKKELTHLAPKDIPINIIADNNRLLSAWKGLSIICSAENLCNMISKEEYDEKGPTMFSKTLKYDFM